MHDSLLLLSTAILADGDSDRMYKYKTISLSCLKS